MSTVHFLKKVIMNGVQNHMQYVSGELFVFSLKRLLAKRQAVSEVTYS